jgi:hypothetical protein
VQNCDISFAVSNSMIAGIYVHGVVDRPLEHISIADNEISVEAANTAYAAQALLVHLYAPGLSITGNGLKSQNIPGTHNNPAGGLFMQLAPDIPASATPLISGNTINGSPTYDFYINILSSGDRTGVAAMIADKFATPDSAWMSAASADTGGGRSFYKKLIETLLPQTRTGLGYGYLGLYLDGAKFSLTDLVFEVYYRQSNRLYAIDFWGYTIDNGAYNESGASAVNERRARLLLNEAGEVYKKDAPFHWTTTTTDTNIPPAP